MNLQKETLDLLKELTDQNEKSLIQIGLKLTEESGELAQAILAYEKANGSSYKNKTIDDVLEESIDVMMVAYSAFYKAGGTPEQFEKIMKEKLLKWEEKSKQ